MGRLDPVVERGDASLSNISVLQSIPLRCIVRQLRESGC
jgi:hypothetical protein